MKATFPSKDLKSNVASLPAAPGVYLFKDADGEIIYIGKAVNLKSRVRSYWNGTSWRDRPKLAVLMPKVTLVETILTNSEKEALILEATLIRQKMPRYNVALKDDKRYPCLAITYDESFPRLIMVRDPSQFRKQNPKARIFGPYVEAGAMWETVRILRKVFPMRQRKTPLFKNRPCMNYHIGLCLGPCQKLVEEEPYNRMVSQVEMFLAGRQNEVVSQLKQEMENTAENLDFEAAAKLRDRLFALESVIEKQEVFFQSQAVNQDVIAQVHNNHLICICLLRIREGKLIGSEAFNLPLVEKTDAIEAFQTFVDQYYMACEDITLPTEIILQHALEDVAPLQEILSSLVGRKVQISVPRRGRKLSLLEMASKNAQLALSRSAQEEAQGNETCNETIVKLKEELQLSNLPRRIECFDISNIQGTDNVASMIVFEGAIAKKSDYRRYKIKSVEGKANDFASMKEVVYRRYSRILDEQKQMPDLIIIDGGKGQLNAALEALEEVGIKEQDIIGLAKKQEEIYFPNKTDPVWLPRRSQALFLLQRARDEAHRFAVSFHRKLRAKRSLVSSMDSLPGVGAARRKLLLDHFGSFDNLKSASFEQIKAISGLPKGVAEKIFSFLHDSSVLV